MTSLIEAKGYKIDKQIGKGGFGVVYKAFDKYNKAVALKQSNIKNGKEKGLDLKAEARFMRILSEGKDSERHYFVKYIDSFEDGENFVLVMEYIENGSLYEFVRKEPLSLDAAIYVTLQIIVAVQYMHDKEIMHRDLSPGNILVVPRSNSRSKFLPKICDFGLAKQLPRSKEKNFTVCGTPQFQDFEHMKKGYGPEIDYSSVGALFYYMLTQKPIQNKVASVNDIRAKIDNEAAVNWICQLVMKDDKYEREFGIKKTLTTPEDIRMQLKAIDCRDKSMPRSSISSRIRSTSRTIREKENIENRDYHEYRRDQYSDTQRFRNDHENRGRSMERRDYGVCRERGNQRIEVKSNGQDYREGYVRQPERRRSSSRQTDSYRRLDSLQLPTNVETRRERRNSVRTIPVAEAELSRKPKSAPGQKVTPWPLAHNMNDLSEVNVVFAEPGRVLLTKEGSSCTITIEVHNSDEVITKIVKLNNAGESSQNLNVYEVEGRHKKRTINDPPVPVGPRTKSVLSSRELDKSPELKTIYDKCNKFVLWCRNRQARCQFIDNVNKVYGDVKINGRVEIRWNDRTIEVDRTKEDLILESVKGGKFTSGEYAYLRQVGRDLLNKDRRAQKYKNSLQYNRNQEAV